MKNQSLGVNYHLVKHIATLSTRKDARGNNLNMELNLIKWNGREVAEYDIREWDDNHNEATYGVKLTAEQIMNLYNAIKENEADILER